MRRLGVVMLGEKVKNEDIKYQITQLDLDGDGKIE